MNEQKGVRSVILVFSASERVIANMIQPKIFITESLWILYKKDLLTGEVVTIKKKIFNHHGHFHRWEWRNPWTIQLARARNQTIRPGILIFF